jgi:hypothetical protein
VRANASGVFADGLLNEKGCPAWAALIDYDGTETQRLRSMKAATHAFTGSIMHIIMEKTRANMSAAKADKIIIELTVPFQYEFSLPYRRVYLYCEYSQKTRTHFYRFCTMVSCTRLN